MKIRIICVGKLKENYLTQCCNEYIKRLSIYGNVEIVEVNEEKEPANASEADELNVRIKEGKRLLVKIKPNEYVYLLDLKGKMFDSIDFSYKLHNVMNEGKSTIDFVIGGSTGLSDEVRERSNEQICLSKMTFTHQMTRCLILEQVYRAFQILNHKPYHK